jgi:PIN domain nuclease of toxin-antitoxin system
MKYLLDTAVWNKGVTLPATIPPRIRTLLGDSDQKGLCSVSLLETAILHRLGRFSYPGDLQHFFTVALSADLRLLELSPAIASRTNKLSVSFQGDPFDRVVVATAATLNLTLVTTDPAIRDASECSVEFYPFRPSRRR